MVGVSGGVGASSLAAALGAASADQGRAGATLVDLDLIGGGIDVTVGLEHLSGPRWPDLARARGRVDGQALRRLLPTGERCAVLAADGRRWVAEPDVMQRRQDLAEDVGAEAAYGAWPPAVVSVLEALRQAGPPLVLDCPAFAVERVRRPGDLLVLVAQTTVRGLADLDAAVAALVDNAPPADGPVVLVTRGGPPDAEVLDVIADQTGLPVFAHLGDDRRVLRTVVRGDWPGRNGPLRRVALDIVEVASECAA